MNLNLSGRRALVTGASRGIGRAVCMALHELGAEVVGTGRNQEALNTLPCANLPWDLADVSQAAELVPRAEDRFKGPMEILVVCHASFTRMTKVHSLEPDEVNAGLTTDLASTLFLLKEAATSMMGARFGRIVLVGSLAAQVGQGKAPLYTSIKAALEGLAKNIAIDFGRYNITCNVVAPGFVRTERFEARSNDHLSLEQHTCLRRIGTPEEIANVVAFLCSDAAAYVTGAIIPVTGGAHLMNLW